MFGLKSIRYNSTIVRGLEWHEATAASIATIANALDSDIVIDGDHKIVILSKN